MRTPIYLCAIAALFPFTPAAAEEDDTPSLLAYLGLSAADGKTTVGEGAAAVEGTMLVSALAIKAAAKIQENIRAQAGTSQVILLGKDEKFSLVPMRQADRALARLESKTTEFLRQAERVDCNKKPQPIRNNGWKSLDLGVAEAADSKPKFDLTAADILGAARFSTALSAVPVDLGLELLKSAMRVSDGPVTWVSPGDVMDSRAAESYRERLENIEDKVKKYSGKKCPADEDVGKVADAILAASAEMVASKDGAPSLIDQAGLAAGLTRGGADSPKVLRIDVSKAGGTLVNSSNLLTTIGYPALNIRGGMVITYRLIDPSTGANEAAGIVTCRYRNQLLLTVNEHPPTPYDDKKAICTTMAQYPPVGT